MDSYSFETGRQIPSSQLTALWTAQNSPSQLIHTVTLKGTKEPAYFSIVLDSGSTPMECIRGEEVHCTYAWMISVVETNA